MLNKKKQNFFLASIPILSLSLQYLIQFNMGRKKTLSRLLVLMGRTRLLSCVKVIIMSKIGKNFIIKDVYKD